MCRWLGLQTFWLIHFGFTSRDLDDDRWPSRNATLLKRIKAKPEGGSEPLQTVLRLTATQRRSLE